MARKIYIFDTTLRDGEQSPGATMNSQEKLLVARQLERLGVDAIEAGFPVSSQDDFKAVSLIAENIRNCEVVALARANKEDIDTAWEAIKKAERPRIHTFIATSDIHLKYKLKKTRDEVLEQIERAVKYARRYVDNVEFSAEDATRSEVPYLIKAIQVAVDAGAKVINIPDTVGYITSFEFQELIRTIKEDVRGIEKVILSVHCHNDLGLAVANSLSAIRAGADQVECTINGLGERAGNASLEEIVMAIKTRRDVFDCYTDIVTEQLYPTSRLVSKITGISVQPNKAIVGANAFAHEAGIHQDGILKARLTYEIMTPESVGIPKSSLVLGKHSGRHAFRERIKELGYELDEKELTVAFKRFKALADVKKYVYDEDIEMIIMDEIYRIPEKYRLLHLNVVCGTNTIPVATVKMEIDGSTYQEVATGNGPVDATYKVIKKLTKTSSRLVEFSVTSITGGMDAQGEVFIKLEEKGRRVTGKGVDTDIIVASARAYINALNRLEYLKKRTGE
jgi:2-isopropylmalate synthase